MIDHTYQEQLGLMEGDCCDAAGAMPHKKETSSERWVCSVAGCPVTVEVRVLLPTSDLLSEMHLLFHDLTQGFPTHWEGRCLRGLLLGAHGEPV